MRRTGEHPGTADQQRHADRLLVGQPLPDVAVLAQHVAVVGGEHQQRAVELAALAQRAHGRGDGAVDRLQRLDAPLELGVDLLVRDGGPVPQERRLGLVVGVVPRRQVRVRANAPRRGRRGRGSPGSAAASSRRRRTGDASHVGSRRATPTGRRGRGRAGRSARIDLRGLVAQVVGDVAVADPVEVTVVPAS